MLHIDRSMGRKVTGVLTMVKAIVGANWGDEGKGKITDMLATSADVFRAVQMPVTLLKINTANLRFICFRPAFSTIT